MGTNRIDLKSRRPLIIAGPCSAETEEQTVETCLRLAESGQVDMLRAGVWKPRTKPNTFEGVGERGLAWLSKVKQMTGMPYGVEVANAKHVYTALSYGVDMVWVGARTTVSPFSVQEIADALRGSDVKVLIKNPMSPDIELWAGAVARMLNAGIKPENIGLIHRGFVYYGKSRFRNPPMWHLAIEMRRRFPDMVMLGDPSHICGNRELLAEVSQKAADLSYDGLIIESHINPNQAWSDASQQVTPGQLLDLLEQVKWRADNVENQEYLNALDRCRGEIDQLDAEIFNLLSQRMTVSEEIGHIKKVNNVAILQGGRWNAIVERITSQAQRLNLSEEFLQTVLEAIHLESINHQNKVMNE